MPFLTCTKGRWAAYEKYSDDHEKRVCPLFQGQAARARHADFVVASSRGATAEHAFKASTENFEGMEAGSEITSDLYTIAVEQSSTLSVTDSADQIPENGGSKALLVSMEGKANFYPGAKITPKDSLNL